MDEDETDRKPIKQVVVMPFEMAEALDEWCAKHPERPGRPAAIRWAIAQFLKSEYVRQHQRKRAKP